MHIVPIIILLAIIVFLVVLSRFFVPKPAPRYFPPDGKPSIEDLLDRYREVAGEAFAAAVQNALRPYYRIVPSTDEPQPRSKMGGLPDLPENIDWPHYNGKSLSFVCQLDFAEVPSSEIRDLLPATGTLYVFYDQDQICWGYEPEHKGAWAAIYVEDSAKAGLPRKTPEDLEVIFSERRVQITPGLCTPDLLGYAPLDSLNKHQQDAVFEVELQYDEAQAQADHHLLGYAHSIQDPRMDLECQLASNGVYAGNDKAFESTRGKELAPGAKEWRLLLQVDSDGDMDWADGGRLYFWIREPDLKENHFDRAWAILQCY